MFDPMEAAQRATPPAMRPALRWQWSRLPELAAAELYAVLAARQQVFTVEQRCAFQDADGLDFHAWHLLAWTGSGEPPVLAAYLRVLDPGCKFAEPSIGRVLTVPAYRAVGLGRVLMGEGVARTRQLWPGLPIRIAAQQRLEAFYASLGFRTASAPYDEDGIAHVDMLIATVSPLPGAPRGML
jgi:ElaA protein